MMVKEERIRIMIISVQESTRRTEWEGGMMAKEAVECPPLPQERELDDVSLHSYERIRARNKNLKQ